MDEGGASGEQAGPLQEPTNTAQSRKAAGVQGGGLMSSLAQAGPPSSGQADQAGKMSGKGRRSSGGGLKPMEYYWSAMNEELAKYDAGPLPDDWKIIAKPRANQPSHVDVEYIPPGAGEAKKDRCRSKLEVLRKFGITPDSRTTLRGPVSKSGASDSASKRATQQEPTCSREEALAHAEAAFKEFKVPHELPGGVVVTSLGKISQIADFNTATDRWPLGYTAQMEEPAVGIFICAISGDATSGPRFTVSLQDPDGHREELAEAESPDAVWKRILELREQAAVGKAPPSATPHNTGGPHPAAQQNGEGATVSAPKADEEGGPSHASHPDGEGGPSTAPGADDKGGTPPVAQPSGEGGPPPAPAAKADSVAQNGDAAPGGKMGNGIEEQGKFPQGEVPLWKSLANLKVTKGVGGLERFGLTDEAVLKAIEGMPGVAECKGYKLVEERGTWEGHMTRLLASRNVATKTRGAGKKTASQKMTNFFKPTDGRDGRSAKRKRERPASLDGPGGKARLSAGGDGNVSVIMGAESEERARKSAKKSGRGRNTEEEVHKFVESLLRRVEQGVPKLEKKRAIEEKKKAAADAKLAQIEERSRRSEAASAPTMVQTLLDIGKDVEDSLLPEAAAQPPPPHPLPGANCLPARVLPGLLELRELLGRFSESLELGEVPSLTELADAVASPAPEGRDPFNNVMAAVADLLAEEAFEAALEVASSANSDIKAKELSAALPTAQDHSWPEIARRLFLLAAIGAMVQRSKGQASGGLDVALGPLVGSSPLSALGPGIVLNGLVAGALPHDPKATLAALPVAACHAAPAALIARMDAHALRATEQMLTQRGAGAIEPLLEPQSIVMCRRLLLHLLSIRGPKNSDSILSKLDVLYHGGEEAAVAASGKMGFSPLDLHTVAMRVDCGVYASMRNGLSAFAADVRYVCHLFQAAAGNRKSDFGHSLQSKRAPQIAAEVLAKLDGLMGLAQAGTLQPPSGKKSQSAAPSREGSDADDADVDTYDETTDLASPLQLGQGCCVCWVEEGKILLCSGCGEEYHTYCLNPPLEQIPDEDWFCSTCCADKEGKKAEPLYQQSIGRPRNAIPADTFLAAAFQLEGQEYLELSIEERVRLACLLASLVEGSMAVREALDRDESARKELRRELNDLRASIKRLEGEMLEAELQEKERERERAEKAKARGLDFDEAPQPRRRTRAEEQAGDKLVTDRTRVEDIQRALQAEASSVRSEPLGYDRHWNRYWLLDCSGHDKLGTVYVEQRMAGGDPIATASSNGILGPMADISYRIDNLASATYSPAAWGVYDTEESLQSLINFLNFRGQREGPLKKALKQHLKTVRERSKPPVPAASAPAGQPVLAAEQPVASGGAGDEATSPSHAKDDKSGCEANELANGGRIDRLGEGGAGNPADRDENAAVKAEAVLINGIADSSGHDANVIADSDAQDDEPATPIARLAAEIADTIDALGPDSMDAARGTQERLNLWRQLLDNASSPQELMAAVVLAEGFIRPERLKPWWRLWAYPAPQLSSAGTLTAVRLRVKMLGAAVRRGALPRGIAAAEAAEPRATRQQVGRVLRERTQIRTYREDSGQDSFEDDAAVARRLDAEINSGTRSTRRREARVSSDEGGPQELPGARRSQPAPKSKSQLRQVLASSDSSESSEGAQAAQGVSEDGDEAIETQPVQLNPVEGRRRLHKAA